MKKNNKRNGGRGHWHNIKNILCKGNKNIIFDINKKKKGKGSHKYNIYKNSTSVDEAVSKGANIPDLIYDIQRGYCRFAAEEDHRAVFPDLSFPLHISDSSDSKLLLLASVTEECADTDSGSAGAASIRDAASSLTFLKNYKIF